MEYGCVYSFVSRRSTTAETTAAAAAHLGATTYMFYSHIRTRYVSEGSVQQHPPPWPCSSKQGTHIQCLDTGIAHSCRGKGLAWPVVLYMGKQSRECTYTGDHVGRFSWRCRVWQFHLVVLSIHAETESPSVKESRRRYISSNRKWKRKFSIRTRYV